MFAATARAPHNIKVNNEANSFELQWDPPDDDGGSNILTYDIEMTEIILDLDDPWWEHYSTSRNNTHQLDDLKQGEYRFRVAAKTRAGIGEYSDASELVIMKISGTQLCTV